MSFLVRKITRPKWPTDSNTSTSDVLADAITVDLKTTANTLSTWEIESKEAIDEAVLALAANQKNIERIDVISIERQQVEAAGLMVVDKKGDTVVEDLIDTHKDISELTYAKLGVVSQLILKSLPDSHIRYNRARLLSILRAAVEAGRLNIEDLKDEDAKDKLRSTS